MFCPNCGANNPDAANICAQCNQPIPRFSSTPQVAQPVPAPPVAVPAAPSMPGAPAVRPVEIPNYLTQSIIMTTASVLCCSMLSLPFSIIALVYSTQVNSKIAVNDIAGAIASSKNAKLFNWIAFGIVMAGIALGIVYVILIALGVASNILQR
ncbi:MAG TPA: CD225/dispanin family protein [Terriglobales bacterium]|nr:CD225/dispanin family protein [Terriglobales bacterium]